MPIIPPTHFHPPFHHTHPPFHLHQPSSIPTSALDLDIPGIVRFPAAVPPNLLPFLLRASRTSALTREDVTILKEAVFTPDLLGDLIIDYSTLLITIRGQPAVSPAETLRQAQRRIDLVPGMSERLRIFALPEYKTAFELAVAASLDPTLMNRPASTSSSSNGTATPPLPTLCTEKYSGNSYEPVFVVVPAEATPKPQGSAELAFGFASFIATVVTCFLYSTDVFSFNTAFLQKALETLPTTPEGVATPEAIDAASEVVGRVFQILGGIVGLQLTHDLGHAMAAALHKVSCSCC